MSLKDSSEGDSIKNLLNRLKFTVKINAAESADRFRNLITDIRVDRFRTLITDIKIEKLSKVSRKTKAAAAAGVMGAVVISAALLLNMGPDVYKLTIAGEDAGYLTEPEMVPLAVEEIKADLSEKTEAEIAADDKAIVLEKVDLKARDVALLNDRQLKEALLAADLFKADAWAVNINGANVAAVLTEAEANSILDGVKRHYQSGGSELVSAGFKEGVTVTKAAVNTAEVMKPEDAVNLILTGTKEPKVYTVQQGDTLWDIAAANGMSPEELQDANPGFDPNRLKIGQQLNLFLTKPYVTVQTKEIVSATEKINFGTVYELTNTLYKGEVKVKTPGIYGAREIKTELIKENGVVVASAQLDSVVTAEPQDQVALKGTKSIATFTGTGSLSSPVAHIEISSAYGVNRGSTRHQGVDFRNPKGTPILAADDGVVVSVTSNGSYGKTVRLSHGNGLETLYAHCNTILVSTGQVVKKGEQIATVGATGNATGYHLHFEVRKNGVPQNPMNYL